MSAASDQTFPLATAFGKDSRGATAVEFGLLAAPFLAVVCAIFELGYVQFSNELLENAVTQAGRAMLTGRMQAAKVSDAQQFVNQYFCQTTGRSLPTFFDCSRLTVDVRPAASFSAGDTSKGFYKASDNKFCPGQPGQIMVLRVAYPLPSIMPLDLFATSVGVVNDVPGLAGSYHVLVGRALFQEENYAGSYAPPAGC